MKNKNEIRDVESEEHARKIGYGIEDLAIWDQLKDAHKAGLDARDKLDNEALKLAVEQIEGIILALVQHGQNINPGFLIEHLRKQLAEIKKLTGGES